jgi:hypothetical protein
MRVETETRKQKEKKKYERVDRGKHERNRQTEKTKQKMKEVKWVEHGIKLRKDKTTQEIVITGVKRKHKTKIVF